MTDEGTHLRELLEMHMAEEKWLRGVAKRQRQTLYEMTRLIFADRHQLLDMAEHRLKDERQRLKRRRKSLESDS